MAAMQVNVKKKACRKSLKDTWPLHLMLLPGNILMGIFGTYVLVIGAVISFQKFKPAMGMLRSKWCGLANYIYMFQLPDTYNIFRNTLQIAIGKIILTQLVAIVFALLLNEVRSRHYQKTLQTIVYIPHFMSWVILAVVVNSLFGSDGSINMLLQSLGITHEAIWFLGSNQLFQPMMILTETWKEYGYAAIIFIAALAGIDPTLYEAAAIDGATRFQRMIHITLPGISTVIILVSVLQIANILNAGFDQIYNLLTPVVYETGDVVDTYVYRMGLINNQYSIATAVGFSKSVISFVLIMLSQFLAGKFANYSIF